jgi:SPP1 family phage portal protein
MMFSESKAAQDKRIAEWQAVCGTAYRLILPDKRGGEDDAPFEIYTLDPRDTFIVYSNEVGEKPMLGVKYSTTESNDVIFSIYSPNHFWKIKNREIVESQSHALGIIPIVEYPGNTARLGAFEIVLPLLDAINNVVSNRLDGVEQFIQAFIKFVNCDITTEDFQALKDLGAIKVKSSDGQQADVDIVTNELNQMQTQTLIDDLYQTVLTICGLPSMSNGSTSDSSNNGAVILKNGWQGAETRAKDSELMFKEAEKNALKLVLRIIRDTKGLSDELYALRLKDIALQFTRRNYENIQSKAQVLTQMLAQNKIHPRLAFAHCGLFTDPEDAYRVSEEYANEQAEKMSTKNDNKEGDNDVGNEAETDD